MLTITINNITYEVYFTFKTTIYPYDRVVSVNILTVLKNDSGGTPLTKIQIEPYVKNELLNPLV